MHAFEYYQQNHSTQWMVMPLNYQHNHSTQWMVMPLNQARREGGGGISPGPHLKGPQLESESLKLSRFFKLVSAFLKLRAPYSIAPHAV
jgi:hypothetical protein